MALLRGKVYLAESLMSFMPIQTATRALDRVTGRTGRA